MVTLTLTPTSYSITATVGGLDATHAYPRTFDWYLDGVFKARNQSEPLVSSYAYTVAPVYFWSLHTVTVEIWDAEHETLYETLTGSTNTTLASLPEWDWTASNGDTTAAQTQAAYTALTTKGQTATMVHEVWNDLMEYITEAREQTGQPLIDRTVLTLGQYDPLLASIMNAAVTNVNYPRWTWRDDPNDYDEDAGRSSYLGRLAFRRMDIVFGRYIIELAKNLNVVRRIYSGAEPLALVSASAAARLTASASPLARRSAPLTASPYARLGVTANGSADPSRRLTAGTELHLFPDADLIAVLWRQFVAHTGVRLWISAATLRTGAARPFAASTAARLSLSGAMTGFDTVPLFPAPVRAVLGLTAAAARTAALGLNATPVRAVLGLSANAARMAVLSLNRAHAPAKLTAVAEAAALRFVTAAAGAAHTLTLAGTAEAARPSYLPASSTSLALTGAGALGLSATLPVPQTAWSTVLSATAGLSGLQTVSLSAATTARVALSATMTGEEPSGWEYPVEEADGLLVRQVHLVYHNVPNEHIQIDWYREAELSGGTAFSLTTVANGFASRGWEYPVRIPDGFTGRVLKVYQSVSVTQTGDEIEVT